MTAGTLLGMTAFVTGGSKGMGFNTARLLVRDGASVVIMGRRSEVLEAARHELLQEAPDAVVKIAVGDAGNEEDVRRGLEAAYAVHGRLDMVAATIGTSNFRPLLMHTTATMLEDFERNTLSAFLAIRFGAPLMKEGGAICCVSSSAGVEPMKYLASYCTAKGGLEQLVRTAALELASAKIRVNAIRPGLTRSEATERSLLNDAETLRRYLDRIPFARPGESHEVAAGIRFLLGPESAFVTGQSLAIDGGLELASQPDLSHIVERTYGAKALEAARAGREF